MDKRVGHNNPVEELCDETHSIADDDSFSKLAYI